MSRRSAFLAVVAFVAATAGGIDGVVTPALAADSCDGVWVVIDARTAGGSLTSRCAEGDPSSGIRALGGAGHEVAYVPGQPGLVCTIDARPDPCNGAPSDAYWSYWYASAGGSWTYSNQGAGARDPAPGTVEGWRFGDGSAPPGTTPPSNEEPEPEPAPRTEPPPDSSGDGSSSGSPTGEAGPGPDASERTDEDPDPQATDAPEPAEGSDPDRDDPDGSGSGDDPDGSGSGDDAADRADGAGREADAPETSEPESLDGQAVSRESASTDDGPPWNLFLAVAVVAAIGGATLYRRRRQRPPPRSVG